MANFLDLTTGLPALWAKIKSKFYTKAEVDALIPEIEQSDWDEITLTNQAYIQNKPAIKTGEGENSVMIGQIEQDANAAIYTIYVTGSGRTLSFTTEETLPSNNNIKYYGIYYDTVEDSYASIKAIDTSAGTISINRAYGSAGVTNREVHIFYKYKITSGKYSYAEGNYSSALVDYSHAEGAQTRAAGTASHSEGNRTQANGMHSHAEGTITYANNAASHTEGSNTIASGNYQHVQGKYNIEDSEGVYADIVGNGSSSARSNAYTLDWSGNGWYAGKVSAGTVASPANPTAANDLATKAYVDAATAGVSPNLSGLADTNISTPQPNQALIFHERSGKWVNMDIPYRSITTLTDTDISNPADGQVLQYDATNEVWVNGDLPDDTPFIVTMTSGISEGEYWYQSDKNYSQIVAAYNEGKRCYAKSGSILYPITVVSNNVVRFSAAMPITNTMSGYSITSNNIITYKTSRIPQSLDDLTDVSVSPTNGQVLTYVSSVNKWKAADVATDLTGLTDTTISSPAEGQVLSYDSATSKWINTALPAGITETRVNELITAALAQYGDGDTATYGYNDASEVNY